MGELIKIINVIDFIFNYFIVKKKKNTSIFYEKKLALSSKQSYLGCSRLS